MALPLMPGLNQLPICRCLIFQAPSCRRVVKLQIVGYPLGAFSTDIATTSPANLLCSLVTSHGF